MFADKCVLLLILELALASKVDLSLLESLIVAVNPQDSSTICLVGADQVEMDWPLVLMSLAHIEDLDGVSYCQGLFIFVDSLSDHATTTTLTNMKGRIRQHVKLAIIISNSPSESEMRQVMQHGLPSVQLRHVVVTPSWTKANQWNLIVNSFSDGYRQVDSWNGSVLQNHGSQLFAQSLANLHGQTLTAAGFDYAPFTTSAPGATAFDGIEYQILQDIAQKLNFKIQVQPPQSGRLWDGIIADLDNRLVDFGASHFYLIYHRTFTADFSPTIYTDNYCFVVPMAREVPRWMSLFLPFHWTAWTGCFVTIGICIIFLALVSKTTETIQRRLSSLIFGLFGALVEESGELTHILRSNGMKIFVILYVMGFMVLTAGYKGSLMSHLTVPNLAKPMDTAKDVDESGLEVKSLANTVENFLKITTDPYYQHIYQRYSRHTNLVESLEKVYNGDLILTESEQILQYQIQQNYTKDGEYQLHIAKQCIQFFSVVFYLQKNSVYLESFTLIIDRLKEAGLVDKHLKDVLLESERRSQVKLGSDSQKRLSMVDLQGAFIVSTFFLALALMVFVVEVVYPRLMTGGNRTLVFVFTE